MTTDLPDVNVWVALSSVDHSLREAALEYWRTEASSSIAFCRVTALGLIRTLCRKTSLGSVPLAPSEAWRIYLDWRRAPGVSLMTDPAGVEDRLGDLYDEGLVTSRLSTEAYLAAFAISAGLRLVSFDRDFERFPGLDLLRL